MEQREARQEEAEQQQEAPPIPPPRENEERDLKLSSRVASLLFGGDISTSAQPFEKWLSLVRKRSGTFRPSGFPRRNSRIEVMPSGSFSLFSSADLSEQLVRTVPTSKAENPLTFDQPPEISLWERLGNSSALDIESSDFSWNMLSSLHHTEHSSSSEHSEDEMNKALEVMLFGASNSDQQDKITQITVAFNHFGKGLVQRMPRCRFGFFHVVNNDYTHWIMYAIGGNMNPTIISQGNRFIAPDDPNAKSVTKREYTPPSEYKEWVWKSQNDVMMNGAYFNESGGQNERKYDQLDFIPAKDGKYVGQLTEFAGTLSCRVGKPC